MIKTLSEPGPVGDFLVFITGSYKKTLWLTSCFMVKDRCFQPEPGKKGRILLSFVLVSLTLEALTAAGVQAGKEDLKYA